MIDNIITPTDIDVLFATYIWPEKRNRLNYDRQIIENNIEDLNKYLQNHLNMSINIRLYTLGDTLEIMDDDIIICSTIINGKSFKQIIEALINKCDKNLRQSKKYKFLKLTETYSSQLKSVKRLLKQYKENFIKEETK